MKINLKHVHNLYPNSKIICVEEYFVPFDPMNPLSMKWSSILPDRTDVRDPELYYKYGLNFIVTMCIQQNAQQISFKILDTNKEYCYPDFYVTELYEN